MKGKDMRFGILAPRKLGRSPDSDPKYTADICPRVLELAREGKFPESWCAEMDFSMATLYRWANRHPEFERTVLMAWHLLHAHYSEKVQACIDRGNPQTPSLLKVMSRRFPSTWGENVRNTLEGFEARNDEVAIDVPVAKLSDEDIAERIRVLAARRDHDEGVEE